MNNSNRSAALSYEELNSALKRLGLRENPEWIGIILFVRNLIPRMDIISEEQKFLLQQSVVKSLEMKDFSQDNFIRIIRMIQISFTEKIMKDLKLVEEKLDSQKDFSNSLLSQIQVLAQEFKKSMNRQSSELSDFGEKTISHIEHQEDPRTIIEYIRGTIQKIISEARNEARNWEAKARSLEGLAKYDNLLKNLYNRSFFDEYLVTSCANHLAQGRPLSLLMIDVDHFKRINDIWGHLVGDDVLRALAKLVRAHADPKGGVSCRYGGEELCIIMENTSENEAAIMAETLRKGVENYSFVFRKDTGQLGETISFTISVGIAQLQKGQGSSELLGAADRAMYMAKDTGRNKVICYSRMPLNGKKL